MNLRRAKKKKKSPFWASAIIRRSCRIRCLARRKGNPFEKKLNMHQPHENLHWELMSYKLTQRYKIWNLICFRDTELNEAGKTDNYLISLRPFHILPASLMSVIRSRRLLGEGGAEEAVERGGRPRRRGPLMETQRSWGAPAKLSKMCERRVWKTRK